MINPIEKITAVYHDTVAELRKCTWPSWNELVESTVVVMASLVIMAAFVGATDWVVRALIQLLTVGR
ncbi:MAG: preprotein translocase subunit SecE [Lentisphaerae bacterium]|nr:preprotein translocase subunit SecE [Lentisphaerota bacterium]